MERPPILWPQEPGLSRQTIRCAIYTRKSSEEGLDQSFNSLDAQREAGEAYIKSQAHEGWKAVHDRYDDGGHSGGTMERPALQRLLADVRCGRIDVVVVYKIDRLTRSLADFARIVEAFDERSVSFVSVTQAFNTTNSMGRLTLNVLLSFAQFEREVTGERIRDKIAASKAKGMWMGGNPPLGYDLPAPGSRILQVNRDEAETVHFIFARYLELKSVHALQRDLSEKGIFSKRRTTKAGKVIGGLPFSRGALFQLLRNPIYLGCIAHKGVLHEGGHEAIVEREQFGGVGEQLDRQARRHRSSATDRLTESPLTGRLFDASGEPMSPTFSRGRNGRLYRYYVSASLQQGAKSNAALVQRLPASAIEDTVSELIAGWLPRAAVAINVPLAIRLDDEGLVIDLPRDPESDLSKCLADGANIVQSNRTSVRIMVPLALPFRGGKPSIVPGSRRSRPDRNLINGLRKAHSMLTRQRGLPCMDMAPVSKYERDLLRLAFLAPEIQRDILSGRQPPTLTLEKLKRLPIPLSWEKQRSVLGWV
jgi:DNA invertase Pin-like site-specific DNA recombinase